MFVFERLLEMDTMTKKVFASDFLFLFGHGVLIPFRGWSYDRSAYPLFLLPSKTSIGILITFFYPREWQIDLWRSAAKSLKWLLQSKMADILCLLRHAFLESFYGSLHDRHAYPISWRRADYCFVFVFNSMECNNNKLAFEGMPGRKKQNGCFQEKWQTCDFSGFAFWTFLRVYMTLPSDSSIGGWICSAQLP